MRPETRDEVLKAICWVGLALFLVLWWTGRDGDYNPVGVVVLIALWVWGVTLHSGQFSDKKIDHLAEKRRKK